MSTILALAVCAACHGANGVSVGAHVPHLAGQRAGYVEAQLRAFKDGTRKHDVMNPIAAQLSPEDIKSLAAHFSSLPGADPKAKSEPLPNLVKSGVTFPEGYEKSFVKYRVEVDADSKQETHSYASPEAARAAKEGRELPDGAYILVVTVKDGKAASYAAMARGKGWGGEIPAMLRNGDWNYALFDAQRKPRANLNQAECLACHLPQAKASYVFTLKELAAAKP